MPQPCSNLLESSVHFRECLEGAGKETELQSQIPGQAARLAKGSQSQGPGQEPRHLSVQSKHFLFFIRFSLIF